MGEVNKKTNMKKELKWRLGKLPTVEELQTLIKDEVITKEEARNILFTEIKEDDPKDLKEEIKFLRELVDKLSENRTQIVTTIKAVQVPYQQYPFWQKYDYWCQPSISSSGTSTNVYGSGNYLLSNIN